jgi:hypothetical protein
MRGGRQVAGGHHSLPRLWAKLSKMQPPFKRSSAANPIDNDDPLIGAFRNDLEHQRKNGARTRKTRVAAIRWPFRYAIRRPSPSRSFGSAGSGDRLPEGYTLASRSSLL